MANAEPFVEGRLNRSKIVVFSKSYSPEGKICANLLKEYNTLLPDDIFEWINFDKRSDCSQVEDCLWMLSGKNNREVPLMFVKQRCIGGYDEIVQMHNDGRLTKMLKNLHLDDATVDDSSDGQDPESFQITVRVQELDDTELLVKVADSLTSSEYHADYDYLTKVAGVNTTLSELQMLFQQALEERSKIAEVHLSAEAHHSNVLLDVQPEWMFIGGKNKSINGLPPRRTISKETSSFILRKCTHIKNNSVDVGRKISSIIPEESIASDT